MRNLSVIAQPEPHNGPWVRRHPRTAGVLLLIGLHLLFIGLPLLLASMPVGSAGRGTSSGVSILEWTGLKGEVAPLLIGLVQLYYVIPATLLLLKLRWPDVAKGIVMGAVATFVLNLGGCGLFYWQLSKIG